MYVADKFSQIGVLLAKDRFVAVLEELAVPAVSLVERYCVTREDAGHDRMERDLARFAEQMSMVAEKSPGVAGSMGVGEHFPYPLYETILVDVITKDEPPLDAAHDDVMKHSFSIETGMTWHK